MSDFSKYKRLILGVLHFLLGVLLLSGIVSKTYSLFIVAFSIYFIIKNKNRNNEAVLFSAYMVGAEVLFRMSGGMFFYELPKYSVILFLFLGLYVEQKRHHISFSYIMYILMLLIGIAFVDIPFTESIRKAIAFNLSGPVLLGISAIYFYRRKLSLKFMLKMLFYMVLPILAMLSLLYFKTPDLNQISFGSNANFKASGGFGPNQVSTILGFGIFVLSVYLFFKKRIFWFLIIDVFIYIYLIFRGLITLSRGGMLTALIAIAVFIFYFIYSKPDKFKHLIKYVGLVTLFGIALWLYTSSATGGMLTNRYTNKNSAGIVKNDISTGRVQIFKTELEGFFNNPFFGLGVGGGKYYRLKTTHIEAASHNEVSRLLGEHGAIGLIILFMLVGIPLNHIRTQSPISKGFLGAFFIFWFLTINHSAMRIAFPAFIYGLSVSIITLNEEKENTLHRKQLKK